VCRRHGASGAPPSLQVTKDDDLDRVANVAGNTPHDGESINAIRAADRIVRANGMTLADVLNPFKQLEVATEAASVLLAELNEARAEIERLHTTGTAVAIWHDVGAQIGTTKAAGRAGARAAPSGASVADR
jgi:hypothetical protein